jgi:hypothetical protein
METGDKILNKRTRQTGTVIEVLPKDGKYRVTLVEGGEAAWEMRDTRKRLLVQDVEVKG